MNSWKSIEPYAGNNTACGFPPLGRTGSAVPGIICGAVASAAELRPRFREPTLDQIFADPIVQQLMRRDLTDEATARRLLLSAV